ncbi:MAG: hypothetical protein R3C02_25825 [Planctomycetaceae bacterium]
MAHRAAIGRTDVVESDWECHVERINETPEQRDEFEQLLARLQRSRAAILA